MCQLYGMLAYQSCEREAANYLKVSCAYQCLRNGNFLSQPSMEAVQTLLIIGDVLSYNMNPGIAYVTFGRSTISAI